MLDKYHYALIRKLILDSIGIAISEDKDYLIDYRLSPIAVELGYSNIQQFVSAIEMGMDDSHKKKIIEAMTTNETSFFRDFFPFETMCEKIFPELIKKKKFDEDIRIWSAVCSSGQEAYSIAFLINESFPTHWNSIRIYGSDISTKMLEKAKEGRYSCFEIKRGIPESKVNLFFHKENETYIVRDIYKKKIDFFELNLLNISNAVGRMDCILLRNVLIYFNDPTRDRIIQNIKQLLKPSGFLVLGSTEYLKNPGSDFIVHSHGKTTIYERR